MLLIGLTGSIATGKTHVARLFRAMDVPVFDADRTVHALFGKGGAAVSAISALFPEVALADGSVDRAALGRIVFRDARALAGLEAIVHPLVRQAEHRFLRQAARCRTPVVVLDIPLLFETGGERRVDRVVAVGCSEALQAQRAIRRPGMTRERLAAIRSKQMPTPEKNRRSDLFIPSGYDRGEVQRRLVGFLGELDHVHPAIWPDRYMNAATIDRRIGHA